MDAPTATVVVVARDRWTGTPVHLRELLDATDARHPVVLVAAGVPPSVREELDSVVARAGGRVHTIERDEFLPGNVARNLGASHPAAHAAEWLAFVENDVVLDAGWLDTLLDRAVATGADVVSPVYLMDGATGRTVHGLGADLELVGPPGARRMIETQHHLGRDWAEIAATVPETDHVQTEPHCFVMQRAFFDDLGGLDEGLLGWFDHTDLGLHVLARGARSVVVPSVTCLYLPPPPLARVDRRTFAMRWGKPWYDSSLQRICATWGLDPAGPEWENHRLYQRGVRTSIPTRWRGVNRVLARLDPRSAVV